MNDEQVKAMTADIETAVFDTIAFTTPKPLGEATVAIVTSASLHHADDNDFAPTRGVIGSMASEHLAYAGTSSISVRFGSTAARPGQEDAGPGRRCGAAHPGLTVVHAYREYARPRIRGRGPRLHRPRLAAQPANQHRPAPRSVVRLPSGSTEVRVMWAYGEQWLFDAPAVLEMYDKRTGEPAGPRSAIST